jgi:hypothetical protein
MSNSWLCLPPSQVGSSSTGPRLSTCVVLPHALHSSSSSSNTAAQGAESTPTSPLAGASAVIMPVGPLSSAGTNQASPTSSGGSVCGPEQLSQLLRALPRSVRLPVLLVAPTPQAAQQWQELLRQGLGAGLGDAAAQLHVISAQPAHPQQQLAQYPQQQALPPPPQQQQQRSFPHLGAPAAGAPGHPSAPGDGSGSAAAAAAAFSPQQLVQGLRWLAARAPQQPLLTVRERGAARIAQWQSGAL